MAINFRLSYNTGFEYTDLLPRTEMANIENIENSLSYSKVRVTIPAFTGLTQNVGIALTKAQSEAPFIVTLEETDVESKMAYYAIDQIEATQSGLIITRLNRGSNVPINVTILFKERGLRAK